MWIKVQLTKQCIHLAYIIFMSIMNCAAFVLLHGTLFLQLLLVGPSVLRLRTLQTPDRISLVWLVWTCGHCYTAANTAKMINLSLTETRLSCSTSLARQLSAIWESGWADSSAVYYYWYLVLLSTFYLSSYCTTPIIYLVLNLGRVYQ